MVGGLPETSLPPSEPWVCASEMTALWAHPWLRGALGLPSASASDVMGRVDTRSLGRIARRLEAVAAGEIGVVDEMFWAIRSDETHQAYRLVGMVSTCRAEVTLMVSHVHDPHQRVDEVSRLKRLLAERTADLEQLVYMTSHDLRAPLRQVVQMLGAARRCTMPSRTRQMLAFGWDSAHQAMAMHDDLVAFLRTYDDDVIGPRPVDVATVARDAWAYVDAPSSFRLDLADARCTAMGSPLTVLTVLRCLLSNAVRHHDREHGHIVVRAYQDDGLHLVVEDDGPGMHPRDRVQATQLFGRFGLGEDSGSGIGLALVSRAAHATGGLTWLRTRPGRGLAVHVYLRDAHHETER